MLHGSACSFWIGWQVARAVEVRLKLGDVWFIRYLPHLQSGEKPKHKNLKCTYIIIIHHRISSNYHVRFIQFALIFLKLCHVIQSFSQAPMRSGVDLPSGLTGEDAGRISPRFFCWFLMVFAGWLNLVSWCLLMFLDVSRRWFSDGFSSFLVQNIIWDFFNIWIYNLEWCSIDCWHIFVSKASPPLWYSYPKHGVFMSFYPLGLSRVDETQRSPIIS